MSKRQFVLLVVLFGMIVSTFFLQRSAVAFFGSEGGDPIMAAVYVAAVLGFGVSALILRLRGTKDEP